MPQKTADLITEILKVDLSLPREMHREALANHQQIIGMASENLQRANCLCFDLYSKMESLRKDLADLIGRHAEQHLKDSARTHNCEKVFEQAIQIGAEIESVEQKWKIVNWVFQGMVGFEFPETIHMEPVDIREDGMVVSAGIGSNLSELNQIADLVAKLF